MTSPFRATTIEATADGGVTTMARAEGIAVLRQAGDQGHKRISHVNYRAQRIDRNVL